MKHEFIPSYSPPIYATRALKMLRYMGDCSDGQFRTHGRGWKLYELNKKELKNPREFDLFITFYKKHDFSFSNKSTFYNKTPKPRTKTRNDQTWII